MKQRATRFGGAPGPRSGAAGNGKTIRLVGVGDSVIDGVGCSSLGAALVGRTAEALAERLGARVEWKVAARTGANTRQIRRRLLPAVDVRDADFVVISTGVNDVTGLTRIRTFRTELAGLLDEIGAQAPDSTTAVNGLPPMHAFPALPQPLRYTLGLRARQLDAIVADVTAARPGTVRVPLAFDTKDDDPAARFAPDGYHPSESSCGDLAAMIADLLIDVRTR